LKLKHEITSLIFRGVQLANILTTDLCCYSVSFVAAKWKKDNF